jgi:hypothetical protein
LRGEFEFVGARALRDRLGAQAFEDRRERAIDRDFRSGDGFDNIRRVVVGDAHGRDGFERGIDHGVSRMLDGELKLANERVANPRNHFC